MVLAFVLVLTLLGACLLARHWRRPALACLGLALLTVLACGCGFAPRWLLAHLQKGYATGYADWGKRNVVVLLGAGSTRAEGRHVEPALFAHARLLRAVMLYQDCRRRGAQCRIEASGGDAAGLGVPEANLYAQQLQSLGVPATDVLLETRSMNTWQNAQFSAPLLRGFDADRVLLVSSASHLRRASLYFHHFGIPVTPVRADYLPVRLAWLPHAWNLALTDLALHEYLGIARYHVYQALGWNMRATQPGTP